MKKIEVKAGSETISVYETSGPGIPIFLFHGNSSSAESFLEILTGPFGRSHKVIAVSFPGHGLSSRSQRPEATYSLEGLGESIKEIVFRYGRGGYVLAGHSLGGHVLMECLEDFEEARALVLISAPPFSLEVLADVYQPDPTDGCLFRESLDPLQVRKFAESLASPALVAPSIMLRVKRDILSTDGRFRSCLGASIASGKVKDERAAVGKARIPIAVIYGKRDPFIRESYYKTLDIPSLWRSGFIALDGCGHSPHLEDPASFMEVFDAVVADASGPRPEEEAGSNAVSRAFNWEE